MDRPPSIIGNPKGPRGWDNPSYLYAPGAGDGKIEKLYVNIPATQILAGLMTDTVTTLAFPTLDVFYGKEDFVKALNIARQTKHQKRIPKAYMHTTDTHIDLAVMFSVKPIPDALLKTLVPKKSQALVQSWVKPQTELITVAEAGFEKEAFEKSILPFFRMANYISVSIAKRYGTRIGRMIEMKVVEFEDYPKLFSKFMTGR